MGTIENCPECGRLYMKTLLGMCHDCYRLEEEKEAKVAEFVRDNPKSSIAVIHEATGVKEKTIFRMIKNGRFIDVAQVSYNCERCGSPIFEGRLCVNCNDKFLRQVKESEAKRAEQKTIEVPKSAGGWKSGGMYTKDM